MKYHNLRKKLLRKNGFTLMEIIIVIAIIAVLGIIAIILFNPIVQINKGKDAASKHDLAELKKVFEDFYNDKGCYPKVADVCYDPPANPSGDGTYQCHICGKVSTPDGIKPYISQLPCHPDFPAKKYLYQVDNNSCPTWYRVYTILDVSSDPIINTVGCIMNSCGPPYPYIYNYGVSSPNIDLQRSGNFFCPFYNNSTHLNDCNSCIGYASCLQNCPNSKQIYSDFQTCCDNSSPNSCGNSFRYCLDSYNNCNSCGNLSECNANPNCALIGGKKQIFKNSICTQK